METLLILAKPLLLIVILLLLYIFCIKPLLGMLEQPPAATQKKAPAADQDEAESALRLPPKRMTDQERLNRLAQSDPERAKELIRQWLRDEDK